MLRFLPTISWPSTKVKWTGTIFSLQTQIGIVLITFFTNWLFLWTDLVLVVELYHECSGFEALNHSVFKDKGRHQQQKNVFFQVLPESPNPPPDPNLGNLVLFFGRQKRRFARMTEIVLDDDNDGFNDNYDDNFGNFDDNYDKND